MSEDWKNQMNAAVLKMLRRRDAEKRAEDAKRCAAEWEDDSDAVAQEFAERLERKDLE